MRGDPNDGPKDHPSDLSSMVWMDPVPLRSEALTNMVILIIHDHSEPHEGPFRSPHGDLNAFVKFFGRPADALVAFDSGASPSQLREFVEDVVQNLTETGRTPFSEELGLDDHLVTFLMARLTVATGALLLDELKPVSAAVADELPSPLSVAFESFLIVRPSTPESVFWSSSDAPKSTPLGSSMRTGSGAFSESGSVFGVLTLDLKHMLSPPCFSETPA
uniref:Uncharacterized protein n=1 Tax=Pseudomonas phage PMBT23 TaxID=3137284 RepID=A0AAU8BW51_9VIRU